MDPADFDYQLPDELIARRPAPSRTDSRLLCLESGGMVHRQFSELAQCLRSGDLLVINDTRVLPARLFGRKDTGGRVEMLLERILEPQIAQVQLRASRSPVAGQTLLFDGDHQARVLARDGSFFRLAFESPLVPILESQGHVPLPPYIDRPDDAEDQRRYQTVYGRHPGAVAAPTAGLHFDEDLLKSLASSGISRGALTLHVGAGTFKPLEAEQLQAGRLHPEWLEVSDQLCRQISRTRKAGGRVVAVGTTVVRGLETAAAGGELRPYAGETELFIMPGFSFQVVDALITNFHLPASSLLMLVCAFGGTRAVLNAYGEAVAAGYRFYSYGDAMFLERSG